MQGTITPRKAVRFSGTAFGCLPLTEQQRRVDRDLGVIFGVRVCGLFSENGRRYTPDALKRAIPLYEGAKVKRNHPRRPNEERPVDDTFGWLENVRQGDDGALYGDLHFLKAHEYAETVCEAAERNPSLFGLSHNADGKTHTERDGTLVVDEVVAVRSVDLVDGPATNRSLFEAMEPPMKTLRQLAESWKPEAKALLKPLLEDDAYGDMAVADAGDAGWQDSLVAAISALVKSGSEEDHAKAKKIMALLKADAAPAEPVEEADDKKDDTEKKAMESKVTALKRENAALKLCMESSVKPEGVQLKALCRCESDDEMKSLIEAFKPGAPPSPRPRSTSPVPVTESSDDTSYPALFERLTGRKPASAANQ